MFIWMRCCAVFLFASVALMAANAQRFPFVIPGDDTTPTVTSRSGLLHRPAGKYGFVRVEDDHFYAGQDRIRFWGMNLCFSANFPSHEVGTIPFFLRMLIGIQGDGMLGGTRWKRIQNAVVGQRTHC